MNVDPKFELHPDAESLNAFAEGALGEQGRGEMVAHLAECGRCRDVVFLAQETAAEMVTELLVAGAAAPVAGERKKARLRNWRFAWVPAGLVAAAVTVAYVVHVRHVELAAEQARAAAAQMGEMAKAEPKPRLEMRAAPSAAAPQVSAAKAPRPAAPAMANKAATLAAAPPPVSAMASTSGAAVTLSPGAVRTPATLSAVVHEPEAQVAERHEAIERAAEAYQSSATAEKRLKAGAGGAAKEMQSRGMVASAAAPARDAAVDEFSGRVVAGLYKAKQAVLPSGLAAVGTATAKCCMVAVDAEGGVFVSADAGVHWEGVTKQWSGRAVAVRMGAAEEIEIVNDKGQVWVSTGGRIWKAR